MSATLPSSRTYAGVKARMSGSVSIRKRTVKNGDPRYDVQFRRGGRGFRVEHAGTFRTMEAATVRKRKVEIALAGYRTPASDLAELVYFARLGPLIKIGVSKTPLKRCRLLNAELVHTEKGGRNREEELHAMFAEHRESGEWFWSSAGLERYLKDAS